MENQTGTATQARSMSRRFPFDLRKIIGNVELKISRKSQLLRKSKIETGNWFLLPDHCRCSARLSCRWIKLSLSRVAEDISRLRATSSSCRAWNEAKYESKKRETVRKYAWEDCSDQELVWDTCDVICTSRLWSPPMSHQCDCGLFTATSAHILSFSTPQIEFKSGTNVIFVVTTHPWSTDPSLVSFHIQFLSCVFCVVVSGCWRVSGEGDEEELLLLLTKRTAAVPVLFLLSSSSLPFVFATRGEFLMKSSNISTLVCWCLCSRYMRRS